MTIMSNPPGLMQDAASSYARNQPATTAAGAVQQERDASGWERAMAANAARRTAEAQQQIEDARAEPTVAEREAQRDDEQLQVKLEARTGHRGIPLDAMKDVATGCTCSPEWKSLTWTRNGPTPHMKGCPDAMGGGYSSVNDANEVTAWSAINRLAPDTLTLSGVKLAAYRQLESAATAAAEAQQAMAATGVALRDAIQAMCAAMTGVK